MSLSQLIRIRQDCPCLPAYCVHGISLEGALEFSASTSVLAHLTFGHRECHLHFTIEGFSTDGELLDALTDPLINLFTAEEVGRARSFLLVNRLWKALLFEKTLKRVATDTS